MNKYKLKILMPLYNREKFLAKALDSIFMQQTNFEYKVIIIDDASTDNSLHIAEEYKKKYDNIEIIKNEKNLKLLNTIFKGYEYLQNTEYFCVLDPDDYWCDCNYLQKAINFLDANKNYTIYSTNANIIDEKGRSQPYVKHTKGSNITSTYENFLRNGNIIIGTTVNTIFRNVVFQNGIPNNLKKFITETQPRVFRGDSFRNFIHLKFGHAFYVDEMSVVYNIASDGIYSNASNIDKQIINAELFYMLSEFFTDDGLYYIKKSTKILHKILKQIFLLIIKKQTNQVSLQEKQEILRLYENIKKQFNTYNKIFLLNCFDMLTLNYIKCCINTK